MDVLSFTMNGLHEKNHRVDIDPLRHWQMMCAAIDWANPDARYPVIVVANNVDEWSMPIQERRLYWEVCKRAKVVTSRINPHGLYDGGTWACRMATETASAIGGDRLLFLAEDILLNKSVSEMLDEMGSADYVGGNWGDDISLSIQQWGCRLSSFVNDQKCVFEPPFDMCGEWYLYRKLQELGLSAVVSEKHYFHHHDPDSFLTEAKKRGVTIIDIETVEDCAIDAGMYHYERIGFDFRNLELLPDGSTGMGRGDGEVRWLVRNRDGERRMSIYDIRDELICELTQRPSGLWRGRWVRFDKMEIILHRIGS